MISSHTQKSQYYAFKAFGEQLVNTGSALSVFGYGGQVGYYQDASTRLYVRARHLDTGKGRWFSRDPIGFDGGDWNLYRYVTNNPVNFLDPSGLAFCFKYVVPKSKRPPIFATIDPVKFKNCVESSLAQHISNPPKLKQFECACFKEIEDKFKNDKLGIFFDILNALPKCIEEKKTDWRGILLCPAEDIGKSLGKDCSDAALKDLANNILQNCFRSSLTPVPTCSNPVVIVDDGGPF